MKRMEIDAIERRLRRQRLPGAPERLASRIMSRAAVLPAPVAIVWSDRLWYSRTARLGWAAAILLLLAAEVVALPGNSGPLLERGQSDSRLVDLAADLSLDSIWSERLLATEVQIGPGLADLQAAVNAL